MNALTRSKDHPPVQLHRKPSALGRAGIVHRGASRFAMVSGSLLWAALLCACGGGTGLGDTTVLSGQIKGWTQGAAYTLDATVGSSTVATSTIDAGGNFSITLPGAATLTSDLSLISSDFALGTACTGQVVVTPSTAMGGGAGLDAVMGNSDIIIEQASGIAPMVGAINLSAAFYYYADQDATAMGSLTCTAMGTVQLNVDLSLNKGWNLLVEHVDGTTTAAGAASGTESVATAALPAGLSWLQNPGF